MARESFSKCMKTFPSFLDMKIPQRQKEHKLKSIKDKLSHEMKMSGFEMDAEWEAAYNCISFIHWLMGEHKEAMKHAEEVLMRNKSNIFALANLALMYEERKQYWKADKVIDDLKLLACRRDLLGAAKYELAFAYSRFGPKFYKYSIDLFHEIITDNDIDGEILYLSKFGLALLLKRQLHVSNIVHFEHVSDYRNSARQATEVLFDVIQNVSSDKYRARGWAMLGEIAHMVDQQNDPKLKLSHILPERIKETKEREFFERAYNICDNDVYVLERFGKHARYWKEYKLSEKYLRRSLKIRETAFAHHHLALTLRSALIDSSIRTPSAGREKLPQHQHSYPCSSDTWCLVQGKKNRYPQPSATIDPCRSSRPRRDPTLFEPEHYTHSLSSNKQAIPEKYKAVSFIVSPKRAYTFPDDSRTAEIMRHLDMSILCAPSNVMAMYEKGLLLRSLRRYEEAIETFMQASKEDDCTRLQQVSCLEQHALCLIDLASTKSSETSVTESLYHDAETLLFIALQNSACIAADLPVHLMAELSFPSIKEMLTRKRQKGRHSYRRTLEEHAQLYELVGEYGQALSFYKEISEMSEESAKDPNIMFKIAECYVRQGDYSSSLLFLDLIEASCTQLVGQHRKLYVEAYLNGALHALKLGETHQETAKLRFKRIIKLCLKRNLDNYKNGDEFEYDMHIHSPKSVEENTSCMYKFFTDLCGFVVSNNDEEIMPGTLKINAKAAVMEHSCLILFVFNEEPLSYDFLFYVNMAVKLNLEKGTGPDIVSICFGQVDVPVELQQFTVIHQPVQLELSKMNEDDTHHWIRQFFWKVAESTFS
ncbi:hypothetical protein ACJMK2_038386 [Sinanodonta woodiana]|uniref:Tetratricopeptide repeat protein n=1 Tax=Sinanodonta woodiana TaxID=1069815 RepID=A0ABD3WCM0_SINWO